jgi:hypothetical protein
VATSERFLSVVAEQRKATGRSLQITPVVATSAAHLLNDRIEQVTTFQERAHMRKKDVISHDYIRDGHIFDDRTSGDRTWNRIWDDCILAMTISAMTASVMTVIRDGHTGGDRTWNRIWERARRETSSCGRGVNQV